MSIMIKNFVKGFTLTAGACPLLNLNAFERKDKRTPLNIAESLFNHGYCSKVANSKKEQWKHCYRQGRIAGENLCELSYGATFAVAPKSWVFAWRIGNAIRNLKRISESL